MLPLVERFRFEPERAIGCPLAITRAGMVPSPDKMRLETNMHFLHIERGALFRAEEFDNLYAAEIFFSLSRSTAGIGNVRG